MSTPTDRPSWGPLLVVLAGTFVTFLDFFIVNVALPSIQNELHADSASVSLVVAGYGLTFAVGMIPGGRLGDLYGRRRMFGIGLALFTLASVACGLAPTAATLVVARLLQGAAGALLTPQVLAILGTVYRDRHRARAFAAFGFAMGIAGVLGQLLGGVLIRADLFGLDWRTIFLINLPVGMVTLPFVRRVVPESRGDRSRLDLAGTALVSAAVAAIVLPLVEGREHGWPLWVWIALAAGPVLAAAAIVHLRRTDAPLVDLALFRGRSFTAGSAVAFVFALVPASFFFVLALYLQQVRGFDPLFCGVMFTAVGAGYFVALFAAAPIAARLQHGVLALGGTLVAAGAAALVAAEHAATSMPLLPGLALIGFGIGLVLVPLSSLVLAEVDGRHAGAAAGVLATAQQVGAALGVAVVGIVYFGGGFSASLWLLAALAVLTALLTPLVRDRRARESAEQEIESTPDGSGGPSPITRGEQVEQAAA